MNDPEPIQMLWVQGNLSRMEILSVRSFLGNGHPVHLYTYEAGNNIPPEVRVFDASVIIPRVMAPSAPSAPFAGGSMGAFSDYFRYHLLRDRGGWWADMDIVCLKPWRFHQEVLTASTCEKDIGLIANTCVMKFPARHPVMQACVDRFLEINVRDADISETGPLLLHKVINSLDLSGLSLSPPVFCPVPWNNPKLLVQSSLAAWSPDSLKQKLRRPHLSARFSSETVAIHLWHEMWRAEGWDKNNHFPGSSLYEKLQRKWNP